MNIAGGVALITGGTSGLGLATAERFLRAGARVVLVSPSRDKGRAVAERLGDGAVFVAADVSSETEVGAALDAAQELGPLRTVVNCAGVSNAVKTVGSRGAFPLTEFTDVIRVNLIGTFNVIRLFAARVSGAEEVDGERGVVINTASVSAFDGMTGQAAYAASKGGVVGLTLPVARDLAALKIRVVTIAPGLFDTPMFAAVPETARAALGSRTPHPARLGDPAEYAELALHIVANPMVNGETIRLDGALRMAP
ncbi:SDR family NAD(P)-dependent oxidoreductase [Streptomyces catenulae]|uniref:SDR family NAD(P)-dependent oxidoreductase n=1 Tax=Streptomyces catenulae TaxID=66875 RepID=A0ABV2YZR8_9ACTN|nr:SDR family NAD(P)-dependent oxidoreductase [Streptomyces catenulae]